MGNDVIFIVAITSSLSIAGFVCYRMLRYCDDETMRLEKRDWAMGYSDAKRYYRGCGRYADLPILSASQAYINGWSDYQQTCRIIKDASKLS